jgi:hypothetical protein
MFRLVRKYSLDSILHFTTSQMCGFDLWSPINEGVEYVFQHSNDMVFIGGMPFPCESQPRRVSFLLVNSHKMQKILA